jgi:hypothetical protein
LPSFSFSLPTLYFPAPAKFKKRRAGLFLLQALPFDFLNMKRKMAGNTAAADSLQTPEGQGI